MQTRTAGWEERCEAQARGRRGRAGGEPAGHPRAHRRGPEAQELQRVSGPPGRELGREARSATPAPAQGGGLTREQGAAVLLVGLTVGIGAGKSTVSGMLAERGAEVIDADHIAREVVMPCTPAWCKIRDHFGPGVLYPDGSIDRQALADIVFGDPGKLALLNEITHP